MSLEVVLLESDEDEGGVRLLGRSSNPFVVDTVRRHLVGRLGSGVPLNPSLPLHAVLPPKEQDGDE